MAQPLFRMEALRAATEQHLGCTGWDPVAQWRLWFTACVLLSVGLIAGVALMPMETVVAVQLSCHQHCELPAVDVATPTNLLPLAIGQSLWLHAGDHVVKVRVVQVAPTIVVASSEKPGEVVTAWAKAGAQLSTGTHPLIAWAIAAWRAPSN